MSNQHTEAHDSESGEDEAENTMGDVRSRAETVATDVTERSPEGSLLLVAGGVLLAGAIWSERRTRAVIQAFIGAGLVGLGLRKRRSQADEHQRQNVESVEFSESGTVEERIDSHHGDENPRSATEVPGEETEREEGEIQFTEDQTDEPRSEPTLDDSTSEDPRLEDDDEVTEIDISEASMADEASEAVGPSPEQAQPVQTDDTEPESSPPEDQLQHDDDDQTSGSEASEDERSGDADTTTGESSDDSDTAEDRDSGSDS